MTGLESIVKSVKTFANRIHANTVSVLLNLEEDIFVIAFQVLKAKLAIQRSLAQVGVTHFAKIVVLFEA